MIFVDPAKYKQNDVIATIDAMELHELRRIGLAWYNFISLLEGMQQRALGAPECIGPVGFSITSIRQLRDDVNSRCEGLVIPDEMLVMPGGKHILKDRG